MITMRYVLANILLKVTLSTNKTGHQVIRYILLKVALSANKTGNHVIRHIVESGVKHK